MKIDLLNAIQILVDSYNVSFRKMDDSLHNIEEFDGGLRKSLIPTFDFYQMKELILEDLNQFCFLAAQDFCYYRYAFYKPDKDSDLFYILGPWRTGDLPRYRLQEISEILGAQAADVIYGMFRTIPVCKDDSFITAIAQMIERCNPEVNIKQDLIEDYFPFKADRLYMKATDDLFRKYLPAYSIKERYEIEERIMNAVAQGNFEQGLKGFYELKRFDLVNWTPDSLKKMKYHLLICNTLLRKAIERNDVHPYYSSNIFHKYAKQIEMLERNQNADRLVRDMTEEYCSCVHQYSLRKYSPQIQKVINYIHQNLSEELSLKTLANALHISASYLSNLFKQETGQTLTEYINEYRIHTAARLLLWRDEKVTQIAVQVGFIDVNYFTRIFKRIMGVTPTEYRRKNTKFERSSHE